MYHSFLLFSVSLCVWIRTHPLMETIRQGSEQNILVQRLSTNFLYQVPLTVTSTEEKALSILRLFTWYKITGAFVREGKKKKHRILPCIADVKMSPRVCHGQGTTAKHLSHDAHPCTHAENGMCLTTAALKGRRPVQDVVLTTLRWDVTAQMHCTVQ